MLVAVPAGKPAVVANMTQCRLVVSQQPPDLTSGWRVQFRRGTGTAIGSRVNAPPYTRTSGLLATGDYEVWGEWTKSTGVPVISNKTVIAARASVTVAETVATVPIIFRNVLDPDAPTPPPPSTVARYVATTGSNANDGSIGSPWLTISYAVAQLQPGYTLYIRAGTYTGATDMIDSALYTVPSGTSWLDPVTISGYSGETVTIRPPDGTHAVRLTTGAPSYIILQDVTVDYVSHTSGSVEGIYLSTGAHHNRFLRVELKNARRFGVVFSKNGGYADYNEVIDCNIHDIGNGDTDNTNGHGLYISTGHNLVEGCTIHDNDGYGCHFYDDAGPLNTSYNVVRNNAIYNNGLGHSTAFGIIFDYGYDNIAYNNLIYGNNGGVLVYANSFNSKIYNNTIYNNSLSEGVSLEFYASAPIIRNNIVYNNIAGGIVDKGGTGTPTISNNITANPSFVNAGAFNFHLQSGSAARDTGATLGDVATDYDGVARPQGAAYCVGAFEFI